ncbi:MAG: T9SS type A sorting domain-containing protein [Bacteroidota bacterium]
MTANKHANGRDWWITNRLRGEAGFLIYLLTPEGVQGPFYDNAAWYEDTNHDYGSGVECEFSSDGNTYVEHAARIGSAVYSFDRETGNFIFIDTIMLSNTFESNISAGIGLSSSGRFAYVSDWLYVYQYDLEADDIEDSRVLLHTFTNPDSLFIHPHAVHFQLGPDCKLYNFMNSGRYIHRINHPDLPGEACDFELNAVELPFPAFRDQPQFPHFRLGPVGDEGSPCVEGPNAIEESVVPTARLKVYPNPSTGPVRLFLPAGEQPGMWRLYDTQGRPIQETALTPGQDVRVDVTGQLPAGAYLWQLYRDGKLVEMGRIVKQ